MGQPTGTWMSFFRQSAVASLSHPSYLTVLIHSEALGGGGDLGDYLCHVNFCLSAFIRGLYLQTCYKSSASPCP